jgi:hypothetical protein
MCRSVSIRRSGWPDYDVRVLCLGGGGYVLVARRSANFAALRRLRSAMSPRAISSSENSGSDLNRASSPSGCARGARRRKPPPGHSPTRLHASSRSACGDGLTILHPGTPAPHRHPRRPPTGLASPECRSRTPSGEQNQLAVGCRMAAAAVSTYGPSAVPPGPDPTACVAVAPSDLNWREILLLD